MPSIGAFQYLLGVGDAGFGQTEQVGDTRQAAIIPPGGHGMHPSVYQPVGTAECTEGLTSDLEAHGVAEECLSRNQ